MFAESLSISRAIAANPPPRPVGTVLAHGHTHIPACVEHETYVYMNPGSVSIPKEGSPRSYMIFENGLFLWKKLESGDGFMEYIWK